MASNPTLEIIKVSEIKHLNILVKNLDISWAFYSEVLGFSYVNHLGPRKIAASFRGFDFSWRKRSITKENLMRGSTLEFGLTVRECCFGGASEQQWSHPCKGKQSRSNYL